jgi:hypothetical protein
MAVMTPERLAAIAAECRAALAYVSSPRAQSVLREAADALDAVAKPEAHKKLEAR